MLPAPRQHRRRDRRDRRWGGGTARPALSAFLLAAALLGPAPASAQDGTVLQSAPVVWRGTEEILVGAGTADGRRLGTGFQLPEGFGISDFSLSGDGSTVWMTLYNEFASGGPQAQWQVWSLLTGGSGAVRHTIALPEDGASDLDVSTSEHGDVAYLAASYSVLAPGFADREFRFYRASRTGSGSASAVFDTATLPTDEPDFGLGVPTWLRATDDGQAFLWNAGEFISRHDAGMAHTRTVLARRSDIAYNGEELPVGFSGLDISGNGGVWTTATGVRDPKPNAPDNISAAVITQTGPTSVTIEAIEDTIDSTTLNVSDDARTVAYCRGGLGTGSCWVGDQGGLQRAIRAPLDQISTVALADGGGVLYAVNSRSGTATVHTGVLENRDGTVRVRAASRIFVNDAAGFVQLSDGGELLAAPIDVVLTDYASTNGLWLLAPEAPPSGGDPTISNVRYGYDGNGDLVLEADISAADGIGQALVHPLKDRIIDPVLVVPEAENPFYSIRFSFGGLAPVAGKPDTYRITIPLYGRQGLVDGSYTLRLAAMNGAGNRVTFVDLALTAAPSGTDFTDVSATSVFAGDIAWLVDAGVTAGCDAAGLRFCPGGYVTRAQMATFIMRAMGLPTSPVDYFLDDAGNVHETAINAVRAAGITTGCDASGTRFCPGAVINRAQMATFLAQALEVPVASTNYFVDDDGSPHHANINAIREVGIASGCAADRYCPGNPVTRAQMAAFLHHGFAIPE